MYLKKIHVNGNNIHDVQWYTNQLPLICEIDVRKYKFHRTMRYSNNSVFYNLYKHFGSDLVCEKAIQQ